MDPDQDTEQGGDQGLDDEGLSAAGQDRASRSKPGKSKRPGAPKGSSIPGNLGSKFVPGGGRITEPLSPAEARHFVAAVDIAIGAVLAPSYRVDPRDSRIEASGDALSDISKWMPIVRIAPRLAAPLVLTGHQLSLIRELVEEAPADTWWRRLGRRPQPGWEPAVVPGYDRVA